MTFGKLISYKVDGRYKMRLALTASGKGTERGDTALRCPFYL